MTLPKCSPPCAFYWLLPGILKDWFCACVVTLHGYQQLKQAVIMNPPPFCLFKPCICPCEHFLHLLLLLLQVTSSQSYTTMELRQRCSWKDQINMLFVVSETFTCLINLRPALHLYLSVFKHIFKMTFLVFQYPKCSGFKITKAFSWTVFMS